MYLVGSGVAKWTRSVFSLAPEMICLECQETVSILILRNVPLAKTQANYCGRVQLHYQIRLSGFVTVMCLVKSTQFL